MTHDQTIVVFKKSAGQALATLIIAALVGIPGLALADDPVPFTFNDRCVPYEIDPDVMRSFGVDPDKILTTFGAPEDAPPDDGTGNQLGKEANVEAKIQDVLYRIHLSPVDIHRIRDGLKGIERNAHGKENGRHLEMTSCNPVGPESQVVYHFHINIEQGIKGVHKEVSILKVGE